MEASSQENKIIVLKELVVRLYSYYDITPEEAAILVVDLIHSIETQATVLQEYIDRTDHPEYQFALESIFIIIERLHATNLEQVASGLKNLQELPKPVREQKLSQFIAFIKSLIFI